MPVQTSYPTTMPVAIEGALADYSHNEVVTRYNAEASTNINFGRGVAFGSSDNAAILPATESSVLQGIVIHAHSYTTSENTSTGLVPGTILNVLWRGRVWLRNYGAGAVTRGTRLWCRAVAGGGETKGGFESADDSTDMINATPQVVALTSATTGELFIAEVDFTNAPGTP